MSTRLLRLLLFLTLLCLPVVQSSVAQGAPTNSIQYRRASELSVAANAAQPSPPSLPPLATAREDKTTQDQASAAPRPLAEPQSMTIERTNPVVAEDASITEVLAQATSVEASTYYTCALTPGGGVKCWGDNNYGQLGDGTDTHRNIPTDVSGLASGVQAITGGYGHTCALTTGGGVKCWGWNGFGQLGDGTTGGHYTPTDVSGLSSGVQAITAGEAHTCALTTAGGIKCWGYNFFAGLGDGTITDRYTPTDVIGLSSGVQAITAGGHHTCALTTGGGVKCWGGNSVGQIGDGTTNRQRYIPTDVIGLADGVQAITAGAEHTCALKTGGGVKCWGLNHAGQLGDGTTTDRLTPTDVNGLTSGAQAIDSGSSYSYHTCALTTGGGVKCWGTNDFGQLGDGTTTRRYTPTDVSGLSSGVRAITAGGHHTCALTTGGGVKCWGENQYGQLGDGSTTNRYTPVDVTGFRATRGQIYTGGLFIQVPSPEVVDEQDERITMGDHVYLKLPITNIGGSVIANATVDVWGGSQSPDSPVVSIYDGSDWHSGLEYASLELGTLSPGETRDLYFWIYVIDADPTVRDTLWGYTWIDVRTLTGDWRIRINLSPISFSDVVIGNEDMEAGSCLHNPKNYDIEQYAQYAAGACVKADATDVSEDCGPMTPPSHDSDNDNGDPDTPEQAVRNLVNRVNAEFRFKEGQKNHLPRTEDKELVKLRGDPTAIGKCREYADLTTGLLRSLHLPTRIVFGFFRNAGDSGGMGHAWTETYLGPDPDASDWKQADSAWNKAIDEQGAYEKNVRFSMVEEAWAAKYPLSSASTTTDKNWRCIPSCYESPTDCIRCKDESNKAERSGWPPWWLLSCVENVQSDYHNVGTAMALASSSDGALLVNLESPTSVTQGVPLAITAGVTNDTITELNAITTTIALLEYVDSTKRLFEVDPSYQLLNDVGAGETITVTWTITPLLTGSGIPLRFSAESGDLFDYTEEPLVVNEPSTPPDLVLTGVCGLGNASPGQAITLTASVLDDNLEAFSDPATAVTATVIATPTLQFSTTLPLPYCASCTAYQDTFILPDTTPIGDYVVDFEATHPSYDPAQAASGFFVVPQLTTSLSTSETVVGMLDAITITAQVMDRVTVVTDAAVSAEIITPGGTVRVPLSFDSVSGTYELELHPADLAGNLGGEVLAGVWQVQATADLQGGTGTDDGSFTVIGTYPLSEVVISRGETGAELTWPHMGSAVDHYEVYRSSKPYFIPDGTDSVRLSPDVLPVPTAGDEVLFADYDALSGPTISHFYVVQPVDANGQFYLKSNRVGAFNFALVPGAGG